MQSANFKYQTFLRKTLLCNIVLKESPKIIIFVCNIALTINRHYLVFVIYSVFLQFLRYLHYFSDSIKITILSVNLISVNFLHIFIHHFVFPNNFLVDFSVYLCKYWTIRVTWQYLVEFIFLLCLYSFQFWTSLSDSYTMLKSF